MIATNSYRPRIQKVLTELGQVQGWAQKLQADYTVCNNSSKDTQGDLASAQDPLGTCLGDSPYTVVSAEGAEVRTQVGQALSRLRNNQYQLQTVVNRSRGVTGHFLPADRELEQLALELAGQPALATLLNQARQRVEISSSQHQGAERSAGWAQSNAVMSERELSQCGNAMNAVVADAPGKSVAGDAKVVKGRVDQGSRYLSKQAEFTQSSVDYEGVSILCLKDARGLLQQALDQLPADDRGPTAEQAFELGEPLRVHLGSCGEMSELAGSIADREGGFLSL